MHDSHNLSVRCMLLQAHANYFEKLYRLYEALVALHAGVQQFLQQLLAGQFLHYSLDTMLLVSPSPCGCLQRAHNMLVLVKSGKRCCRRGFILPQPACCCIELYAGTCWEAASLNLEAPIPF